MRDPIAIRYVFFVLASATIALQPFGAFCNQPATAAPQKDSKQNAEQKTPVSRLPKMSFDGQPAEALQTPGSVKETDLAKQKPVAKQTSQDANENQPKQPAPLSIPFVEGYDSLDLKIPDFDSTTGALKSFFSIGALRRLDDKHLEIRQSFLGLYKPDGSVDLSVDITKASLDRFTRRLNSSVPVIIWSDEFQITGATMELDTVSKEAKLGGPVRVLIYQSEDNIRDNLESNSSAQEPHSPSASRAEPKEGSSPEASGGKKDRIK